jgi:cytochrome c oxidase assembly protein subunit 15
MPALANGTGGTILTRLLFISTKNRWFHRLTLLTCLMTFLFILLGIDSRLHGTISTDHPHLIFKLEMAHRYLTYAVAGLILFLTLAAPVYRKQFSMLPFLIGLILLPLIISQIYLCKLSSAAQTQPLIVLLHLLAGMTTLCLLWWMGRVTAPNPTMAAHRSTQSLRPWAWLGLLLLGLQIVSGLWVSSNFSNATCANFPFCNGQIVPEIDSATLAVLARPTAAVAPAVLTNIQLIHHWGIFVSAAYLGLFCLILLFNRYLYQTAIFTAILLGAQVTLNFINLAWPHPLSTVLWYHALSIVLLLSVVSLLVRLHHEPQDYWYG